MSDLTLIRGDTAIIPVEVNDAAGNDVDLSGAEVFFTVKARRSDPDSAAVIRKQTGDGITVTVPAEGKLTVTLDPEDTADIGRGRYRYDVQVVADDGTVQTVADGSVLLREDVTLATA